jgi:hypothetical protein
LPNREENLMPRTPSKGLTFEKLRELARAGAEDALKRLRAEIGAIERTFPELATGEQRRAAVNEVKASARRMSAAARKTVSQRMKKYWAERRKAKA